MRREAVQLHTFREPALASQWQFLAERPLRASEKKQPLSTALSRRAQICIADPIYIYIYKIEIYIRMVHVRSLIV